MKFSVCIDMMFSHFDFYDRFAAVKACSIDTVEFWKWSNKDINRVKRELNANGMGVSIFNLDSADGDLSYRLSRGILNTGDCDGLMKGFHESLSAYRELNASGMIVLLGEALADVSYDNQINNIRVGLEKISPVAESEKVNLFIEPLNTTDRSNYFMPYSQPIFNILKEINSPNVKLLFDIYHQQMTEGGIISRLRENIAQIGHFHVADCPGRHEPGTGELNYPNICREIAALNYSGFVGLEYRATVNDEETLGFVKELTNV